MLRETMDPTITLEELSSLLDETGKAHHRAFARSDGYDPEWASWYAPMLQAGIGDRLGRTITRSELTYLLIRAEREHAAAADGSPWPDFYARVILEAA